MNGSARNNDFISLSNILHELHGHRSTVILLYKKYYITVLYYILLLYTIIIYLEVALCWFFI